MRFFAFALVGAVSVVACTQDFGVFSGGEEASDGSVADVILSDGTSSLDGSKADTSIMPPGPDASDANVSIKDSAPSDACASVDTSTCLSTATTCGDACGATSASCRTACGLDFGCGLNCLKAEATCHKKCDTDCVMCTKTAGCMNDMSTCAVSADE